MRKREIEKGKNAREGGVYLTNREGGWERRGGGITWQITSYIDITSVTDNFKKEIGKDRVSQKTQKDRKREKRKRKERMRVKDRERERHKEWQRENKKKK